MTHPSTVPGDAIRALIEERERYESWLSALDARRGATPAHVFDRVQSDYAARLRGVRDRLAEQVAPLRDAEAALARRQDEVVRRLTERQDELAELELRTLVGEYAPEDGERRVQQAAADVRELDADRRGVTDQLTELRDLITRAAVPPPEADQVAGPLPEALAEPAATAAPAPEAAPQEAPAPERAADRPLEAWRPNGGAGDDEGFVGTGPRLDSLAASLGGAVAPAPAPTAGAGQERTLRCQECGEMNYPTEWYCERCGGELAAL